jgi:hypothetical protein
MSPPCLALPVPCLTIVEPDEQVDALFLELEELEQVDLAARLLAVRIDQRNFLKLLWSRRLG